MNPSPKFVFVIVSGASDVPHPALDLKTPLEVAQMPALDRMASSGRVGTLTPVSKTHAGRSDLALLSLFGYSPSQILARRGAIEARWLGVDLKPKDLALSFNFVCSYRGVLDDWGVRDLSPEELTQLTKRLQASVGSDRLSFLPLRDYRGLMLFRGGADLEFSCVPPRFALGKRLVDYLPTGKDAPLLISIMERAQTVLSQSDINRVRLDLGENPAEAIWPWGPGRSFELPSFLSRFGKKGAMVASSPLALGLGRAMGMETRELESGPDKASSLLRAKFLKAIEAYENVDFLAIHVQGAHEQSRAAPAAKVAFLEQLDQHLLGPLIEFLEASKPYRLLVTSDHATSTRCPSEPPPPDVPFVICGNSVRSIRKLPFYEAKARISDLKIEEGESMMEFFFGRRTSERRVDMQTWPHRGDVG